jgi:SAM-dependent methyltransferase
MFDEPDCLAMFLERLAEGPALSVLELGTRAWNGNPPKHHREKILTANSLADWWSVDLLDGEGVGIVCDAHQLSGRFPRAHFDAAIAVDVLEHCRRPWEVADQLALVLRPGAWLYVHVPQTFPVHGYPGDYWRFTTDALRELFAPDRGWWAVATRHLRLCKVVPLVNDTGGTWNFEAPAWLGAEILARRS